MGLVGRVVGLLRPGPRRSPQGWVDETTAWPGGAAGAAAFATPWAALESLARTFDDLEEQQARPHEDPSVLLDDYVRALTALYVVDGEMPRRKGVYGSLGFLVAEHLRRLPWILTWPGMDAYVAYLPEDFRDCGDPDLGGLADEVEAALAEARRWNDEHRAAAVAASRPSVSTASARVTEPAAVTSEPLTRVGLFALVCDEVFRDGKVEDVENRVLNRLAGFLRLDEVRCRKVARRSRERFEAGLLGPARPLDPAALHVAVTGAAHRDGVVDPEEAILVESLRLLLEILGVPASPGMV